MSTKGDAAGVRAIARTYRTFIAITLARLGVEPRDADDVCQEVLLGAARGIDAFDPSLCADPGIALQCWIAGICKRQAAMYRRSARRRGEVLVDDLELDEHQADERHDAGGTEARFLSHERHAVVMSLVDKLATPYREVFVAYAVEELPMEEIAAAKALPVNTAWNRLRLARRDLAVGWARWCARARLEETGAPR